MIQTVVQQFLQHLSERNLEQLTALFAEDIDWDIPGDETKAAWLGKRTRKEDVTIFFQTLWARTEPISVSLDKILYDDDFAVLLGSFQTKMLDTGKVVDSFFCIQVTIQDNMITRYRLYEDSFAVSKALTL